MLARKLVKLLASAPRTKLPSPVETATPYRVVGLVGSGTRTYVTIFSPRVRVTTVPGDPSPKPKNKSEDRSHSGPESGSTLQLLSPNPEAGSTRG